jgi:predicted ABC-type transport system involved in lysophospholipase L1 biosynthesis ATPase subunit
MGFVFQAYFLLPELTALKMTPPSMMGGKPRQAEAANLLGASVSRTVCTTFLPS